MGKVLIKIGTVIEVEEDISPNSADGLRVRAQIKGESRKDTPWAFPLLPKTFQSVPKEGEAVLLFADALGEFDEGQRYYIGPLISQPQFQSYCPSSGATSLLQASSQLPLERPSKEPSVNGAFPNVNDVAVVGRGREDVTLKYDKDSQTSEVDIRAGIRSPYMSSDNPSLVGNIIFNGADPAYIQLKYKDALATRQKHPCCSAVNIVADYINIMSNYDKDVSHNIHDRNTLVKEAEFDNVMEKLHPLAKGDVLVKLLTDIKNAILNHTHSWPGNPNCGDWSGDVDKLRSWTIEDILSDFVRIS